MMNDYTTAPATKMLASHCACCQKELLEADSIEAGIGPECRRKHGYTRPDTTVDPVAFALAVAPLFMDNEAFQTWCVDAMSEGRWQDIANRLVYLVAAEQTGVRVIAAVNALHAAGYVKLSERVAKRLVKIEIVECADNLFTVKTPFNVECVSAFQRVPGRRWDSERKLNRFPVEQKRSILSILQTFFSGNVGRGPKGLFLL